jgi:predicted Fe-S protein YdhL (DUF1289 family)
VQVHFTVPPALAPPPAAGHIRAMDPAAIATPCIKVCVIDGESGLCLGCQRTLAEVANWTGFSDAERAEIMAALAARRARIRPEKLALFG